MEISFLSFLNDIRCFWDSAKEKKVLRYLPGGLCLLALPFFAYWKYGNFLITFTPFYSWGLYLGAFGLFGALLLPKKLAYATDNIVFQHEIYFVQKFYRFLKRKKDRTDLPFLVTRFFAPQNEKKSYPSSEYPLFKYTHSFTGEKSFHLKLERNEKPHLIFLFLESFRAKDVGCLGSERGVTPQFDRLAKEGILFSNFYANSIKTSRAVISSLFGIPSDIDGSETASKVDTPFIGIPHLMKGKEYQTAYLHNGPVDFESQDIFFKKHGYGEVLGKEEMLKKFPEARKTSWGVPDEFLVHYTVDFLAKRRDIPQFLTLFTITNHHPWNLPPHYEPPLFSSSLSRTYRKYLSTFHYSDACLGLFIDLLKEKNLSKNCILFILGDHGYPMGEHEGNLIEQRFLYEENIKVPLLIYADGRILDPKVISSVASQLDLLPTVMDLFQMSGFNLSIGSSLLRLMDKRQVYFHNPYVFKNFGCREGAYKFIHTKLSREIELYNLEKDPFEKENIASEHPELNRSFLHHVKSYEHLFHRLYAERSIMPRESFEVGEPSLFDLN